MISNLINRISRWLEDNLRSIVKPLSPDTRVMVILTMLLLLGSLSIYMTVSSLYTMGKKSSQQIQIKHIEGFKPEPIQKKDSINQINPFKYGN